MDVEGEALPPHLDAVLPRGPPPGHAAHTAVQVQGEGKRLVFEAQTAEGRVKLKMTTRAAGGSTAAALRISKVLYAKLVDEGKTKEECKLLRAHLCTEVQRAADPRRWAKEHSAPEDAWEAMLLKDLGDPGPAASMAKLKFNSMHGNYCFYHEPPLKDRPLYQTSISGCAGSKAIAERVALLSYGRLEAGDAKNPEEIAAFQAELLNDLGVTARDTSSPASSAAERSGWEAKVLDKLRDLGAGRSGGASELQWHAHGVCTFRYPPKRTRFQVTVAMSARSEAVAKLIGLHCFARFQAGHLKQQVTEYRDQVYAQVQDTKARILKTAVDRVAHAGQWHPEPVQIRDESARKRRRTWKRKRARKAKIAAAACASSAAQRQWGARAGDPAATDAASSVRAAEVQEMPLAERHDRSSASSSASSSGSSESDDDSTTSAPSVHWAHGDLESID